MWVTIRAMTEPFIGSEAVASGAVSKSALHRRYTKLFRDVYIDAGMQVSAQTMAMAGWLWSGRKAVVAGRSAAAVLGAKWVNAKDPVELIHANRNRYQGISIRGDRVASDELLLVKGMAVTSPERTALDLACWYPVSQALALLDALARVAPANTEVLQTITNRHPGRRNIRRARRALDLVDAGAQSPKESWLRYLLIEAGFPRPRTQIPIVEDFGRVSAYLDMGWEDVKVAVEYDGEQHRLERRQYTWDIRRMEMLEALGWIVVRVVAGDRRAHILRRVSDALARRAPNQLDVRRSA